MPDFNPDEYLKSTQKTEGFNPDAYLAESGVKKKVSTTDSKSGSGSLNSGGSGDLRFPTSTPKPIVPSVLVGKAKEEATVKVKARKEEILKKNAEKPKSETSKPNGGVGTSFMRGLNSFNEGLFKIPRYLYDAASIPQNAIADLTNNPQWKADYDTVASGKINALGILDRVGDYYKTNGEAYEARKEKFDKGIFESIKGGDLKSAGKQVLNNMAESIPSIAGMYVTGGAGNAAKLGKVSKTLLNALPFASQKNSQMEADNPETPSYVRTINATLNGLSEVVYDQEFGTKAILDDVITSFTKDGKEAAARKAKEFVSGYLENALKKVQPITSGVKNTLEEVSTQYSQNVVDWLTINPDKDLLEGLEDAAIVGGATGTAIKGGGMAINGVLNTKSKEKLNESVKRRTEIIDDLDNANLPDEVKEDLISQLEKENNKITKLSDDAELKLSSLPETEQAEALEAQEKIEALEQSLSAEGVSEGTKQRIQERIEAEQDKLDVLSETASILSKPDTEVSLTKEFQEAEKAFKEDGDQTAFDNKMAEIEARVQQLPENQIKAEEAKQETVGEASQEVAENDMQKNIESPQQAGIISESIQNETPVSQQQEATTEMQGIGDGSLNPVIREIGITESDVKITKYPKVKSDAKEDAYKPSFNKVKSPVNNEGDYNFFSNEDQFAIQIDETDTPKPSDIKILRKGKDGDVKVLNAVEVLNAQGAEKLRGQSQVLFGEDSTDVLKRDFDSALTSIKELFGIKPSSNEQAPTPTEATEQVLPEQGEPQAEGVAVEENVEVGSDTVIPEVDTVNDTPNDTVEEEGTALKNADIEVKRKELGFDAFDKVEAKENPELIKAAKDKIRKGYNVPDLIDDILNKKKEADDEGVVILKLYQLAKEDEILGYNAEITNAIRDGKETVADNLIKKRDLALEEINNAQLAGKKTGTVSARAMQARTIQLLNDFSLANMLISMRESNKGEALTKEQYDKVVELYEEIKLKNELLEIEKERLQKENIDILADRTYKKIVNQTKFEQRKTGRVQQRQAIQTDIDSTLESLRKKLKKQSTTLNSGINPDMIPEIAKLAQLYAKLGINTVQGVVDKIYTDLKDEIEGLNTDDIKAVLANYDYEAQAREEARLKGYKTRTEAKVSELRDRINRGDFAKRKIAPIKLDERALELRDALMKARFDFDVEMLKNELAKRSKLQKANDLLIDVSGVFRAAQATLDLSAVLNQGFIKTVGGLISRNPTKVPKMVLEMLKQTVNEKRYNRWLYDLQENPYYDVIKESGLYISDVKNPKITAREEALQSNLVNKIPIVNILTRGSERAYSSFLNMQRVDTFLKAARVMEMQGKTIETHPNDFKELASYVNSATGRGDLGGLEGASKFLASTMFSPRFLAARVRMLTNLINPYWWKDTPMNVKVMYIKDMAKIALAVSAMMGLAMYAGYDVEDDPRSSDFMKAKKGDTRIDLLQGFGQIIVFISRLLTGKSKNKYGKVRKIDRLYTVWRFLRSKFAPVLAIGTNLLGEEDYLGEEYSYKDVPEEVIPLSAREVVKNWDDDKELRRTLEFLPFTIFGGRVATYK